MKKLLIVSDTFAPRIDGTVRFLNEIIPRLELEFNVSVLAPDFGIHQNPVNHIKTELFNFKFGDFQISKPEFSKVRKTVKKSDVLFVQTISILGLVSIFYAKLYKKPIVIYKHTIEWELVPTASGNSFFKNLIYSFVKSFSRFVYNKCSLIITPSKSIAEKLSWYKFKPKKIVVPIGVNSDLFIPSLNKKHSKQSIGLDPKKIIIGYHGRLANEKGLKNLGRVYSRVNRKYPNVQLVVLGSGLKELEEFLEKKGAIILPPKKNVVPYLQAMDIYCISSLTETSCLSLIEAMSCGLACVSTKTGLITDYVIDGENGFLVDKKDNYHMYKKIEYFIENTEKREKFGYNARRTIKKLFDWNITSKKIIKGINSVLDN